MFSSQPITFQRIEAGVLLLGSIYGYHLVDGSWWLYALLLFSIDIFMAGYLIDNRAGAIVYNVGHSLIIPIILICWGMMLNNVFVQQLSLIWFSHIGVDRLLGYGLKETSGFSHTHLGEIGRK